MKVVILAGGLGTRISEESHLKPKPMIEIDGKPILWHIMKYYSSYGFDEFIICCGYKGFTIKEFFNNYYLYTSDITFDFKNGSGYQTHANASEPWQVTLVDTGLQTATAGRVGRVRKFLEQDEAFLLTYGDGLCDVPLHDLIAYSREQGTYATVTTIQPEGRFGALDMDEHGKVFRFVEKPPGDKAWINGGYMVLKREVLDKITGDTCDLEGHVLPQLALDNQLSAFRHHGFWHPMDTLRDKNNLERIWEMGNAPWKRWED